MTMQQIILPAQPQELPLDGADRPSREERRELVAAALRAAPERSNREIAAEIGCDPKTVGAVRGSLEPREENEIPRRSTKPANEEVQIPQPGASEEIGAPGNSPKLLVDLLHTGVAPELVSRVSAAISGARAPAVPDDRFDWSATNPDVVLYEQRSLAVYENPFGSVVIRVEARWDEDDDPFLCVRPEYLAPLIAALQRYLPR